MSRARTLRRKTERALRRRAEAPAAQQPAATQPAPAQSTAAAAASASTAASAAQAAANRANAQRSTGPRTPEGQARSSQNALKHGLFSKYGREALDLLGEDRAEFAALLDEMRKQYAPADRHEARLVERIALLWWRLERLDALAQARLSARLEQGGDPMVALLEAESIAPAEARLERAIARLHKDLLFLRRYRAREQQKDAKVSARRHIDAMIAQVHAEGEALMLDARRRREAAEAAEEEAGQAEPLPGEGDEESVDAVEHQGLPEERDAATIRETESVDRSAA